MKRLPDIQRRAELEMNRAIIWYEEKRAGLGRDFIAELRDTLARIVESPESFPIDYRHARRALLSRFPYKVYFVVADSGSISVIAVLHSSQSKTRLRGRLK
jgi:plasmid stabilization system protein ParE